MRVPPHDLDAEASILGAVLLRNEAIREIDALTPEDFYSPRHQLVFRAMRELDGRRRAIDTVTLESQLGREGLEAIDGVSFLSDLTAVTPTADNIGVYAEIVREKALIRRVILAAGDALSKGFDAGDADEYVAEVEKSIMLATEKKQQTGPQAIKAVVRAAFSELDRRCSGGGSLVGVPSGLDGLDAITGGFHPGDLVVLAARPGVGKTALALSILANASVGHGFPVIMFSLEMPAAQLGERLLSSEARVDGASLRRGVASRMDMASMSAAANRLVMAPVQIDDSATLSPTELRSRSLRWRHSRDLFPRDGKQFGLVVVDYLQLMRSRGLGKNANREQEIADISRSMKALAKEIGCPVLALAQLNRAVEQREDKRPMLSDLRESGAIEQDADMVLLLYRDEVYTKEKCEKPGVAELDVAKNRSGPTDKTELSYLAKYTRFENLSRRVDF